MRVGVVPAQMRNKRGPGLGATASAGSTTPSASTASRQPHFLPLPDAELDQLAADTLANPNERWTRRGGKFRRALTTRSVGQILTGVAPHLVVASVRRPGTALARAERPIAVQARAAECAVPSPDLVKKGKSCGSAAGGRGAGEPLPGGMSQWRHGAVSFFVVSLPQRRAPGPVGRDSDGAGRYKEMHSAGSEIHGGAGASEIPLSTI